MYIRALFVFAALSCATANADVNPLRWESMGPLGAKIEVLPGAKTSKACHSVQYLAGLGAQAIDRVHANPELAPVDSKAPNAAPRGKWNLEFRFQNGGVIKCQIPMQRKDFQRHRYADKSRGFYWAPIRTEVETRGMETLKGLFQYSYTQPPLYARPLEEIPGVSLPPPTLPARPGGSS